MTTLLLWLLLCILPQRDGVLREETDLTEVNHFYDEYGRLVFDQAIWYDWCAAAKRFDVVAWRLIKSDSQLPRYDFSTQRYISQWYDNDRYRVVSSKWIRESWTQYDPELAEREILPKEKRRELRQK